MKQCLIALLCAAALSGCGSVATVRDEISAQLPVSQRAMDTPILVVEQPRVIERKGPMLPVSEVVYQKNTAAWLRAKTISLTAREPVSLTQIVAQFAAKGVNITSELPLDSITFVGTVNPTDAESALKQVLGSAGLDFKADDARKLVVIKPVASRTWYLSLGNRRSTYSSGEASGGLATTNSSSAQSGAGSQQQQGGQSGGQQNSGTQSQQGGAQAQNTSGSSGSGSNGTNVTAGEDFWGSLDKELTKRLSVLVPNGANSGRGAPAVPQGPSIAQIVPALGPSPIAAPSSAQGNDQPTGGSELYSMKKIGSHALNPETGAVTVQAPHWVLAELDNYFRRTQEMFDTYLSFEGRLLLVTKTRSDSEGIDIQQFARWASDRYGAVLSNNSLGGVTVSFGSGSNIPTVAAGAQQVGGALLGIGSDKDGLKIFNAYLSEMGNVSVMQKPRVATTSGVPGKVSTITPRYYNTVTQTAAAGNTGSATQATSNTIVSKDFGTELMVYPRIDVATGLIRAKIEIRNIIPAGEQQIPQVVSVGNSAQTFIARIPLERRLNYSGEALLRDGDLIIVGGQSEESLQSDENGLPTNGAPLGVVFGTAKSTRESGTYYFALKVSVRKPFQ